MTEEINLPRRTVLGAIGAIGVGSVAGGMRTSAYFSDTETAGVEMVAGELDLKVDWTEHYADGSGDETSDVDVSRTNDSLQYGFPSAADDKLVYVDDKDQFLGNTAIEAFPDTDPSGGTPSEDEYDAQKFQFDNDSGICDIDADLDAVLSSDHRTGGAVEGGVTIGDAPNAQTTAPGDPLVNISDVKPGDFGEVTFSFHFCGNPGYVWLTGDLVDADENGNTEPEAEDEDEYGTDLSEDPNSDELFDNEGDEESEPDGSTRQERVELLDAMKAAVWYDHGVDGKYGADFDYKDDDGSEGDNFRQPEEGFIGAAGSLRNVLRALDGNQLRLSPTPIPNSGSEDHNDDDGGSSVTDTEGIISGEPLMNSDLGFKANRNADCDALAEALVDEDNLDEKPDWVEVKIDDVGETGLSTGFYGGGICPFTIDDEDWENGGVTITTHGEVGAIVIKGGQGGANFYVWNPPVQVDNVTFSTPNEQAISNIKVCCPVDGGNGGGGGQDADGCFPNSTTAYIGFEWWVPTDVGNEIQGDSVSFDLGFYTEQCRHNDGTNPDSEGS